MANKKAKQAQADVADAQVPAADAAATPTVETIETETAEAKKGRKPGVRSILKGSSLFGNLVLPIKFGTPSAVKKSKPAIHLIGPTVDVAIISYANWRAGNFEQFLNGTDKNVARIARWRKDETAIVVEGVGQKYGGFISVDPNHVDAVVAKLRKWQADNKVKPTFNELCEKYTSEEEIANIIINGGAQLEEAFTMLEKTVEVPAKPRKERQKKEAKTEETATASAKETTEVVA